MGYTDLAARDREQLAVFLLSHASKLPVLPSGANHPGRSRWQDRKEGWNRSSYVLAWGRILAASPIHTSTTQVLLYLLPGYLQILPLQGGETMAPRCREFGISRKTGYKTFARLAPQKG